MMLVDEGNDKGLRGGSVVALYEEGILDDNDDVYLSRWDG